ncbi:MAG: hydroxymethylbilane synthase [Sphingomonas sp.]|nr:hydroxymethylbilane synthase [Sphingomonas sp.]RZV53587.1 MAG: hydroxymethylbilane synthase [Sphingomonadaceae bacterium]
MRKVRIGTRGSPLALKQAHLVAEALHAAHSDIDTAIITLKTSGDRVTDRPIAEIGGKAVWTKELDRALLAGETDISVHSMKDVESERPDGLGIAAMLERADVRDKLIGAETIEALPQGARIGTSSPRRAAQLRAIRPDLVPVSLRGNVATRLAKLELGEADATILAAAGLDRLGQGKVGHFIEIDVMLPAAAQGAVGVDARSDDVAMQQLLASIDHKDTHDAVMVERAFILGLGGNCHSPVAALATCDGAAIRLRVALYSEDGSECVTETASFVRGDLEAPLLYAAGMLERAPEAIQSLFA